MSTVNFLYKRDASYVTEAALLALLDWVGSTYSTSCSAVTKQCTQFYSNLFSAEALLSKGDRG